MEASPWALAIFIPLGFILLGMDLLSTPVLTLYFIGFAITWIVLGYLRDLIRFRGKD